VVHEQTKNLEEVEAMLEDNRLLSVVTLHTLEFFRLIKEKKCIFF
jgi:hypothetical protein